MGIENRNGALFYATGIDNSGLIKGVNEAKRYMDELGDKAKQESAEMEGLFKKIGAAAAAYLTFTTGKDMVNQIIRVRGEFQQLDIALETMLGNKQKSDKLMGEVVQLAAKTPFSLTELGKGAKQLIAFKEPADKVADTLRRIGDVAAGVSVPVGELVSAYGKVSAKGKMQAEELNQFAERGVPIISELAKVIGTTDDKIYKMAEQGKIGFKELQQAIMNMTSEGGQFFNLMEKQAGSLTGLVSNLGDAWDRMLNDIGQSNEGFLADGIKGLTSLVENYEDVIKIIGSVALAYGTYKAAIVAVSMAQKAQLLATQIQEYVKMSKALGVATANQIAFNRATLVNPYMAVAAAVAALVGGLVWYSTRTREAIGVSADFKKTLNDEVKSIEGNFKALKNTSEGTDARRIAIENINSKYGEYLGYLLNEKSSLEDIEKAQEDATKALGKNLALKAQEKDLSEYKSKVAEAEEAYSDAIKKIFDKRNVSSAAKGSASAAIDQFIEDLSNSNIKQGFRFVEDFYEKALKDNGILAETFDKIDLETAIEDVITARQNENKVVDDLTNTYDAYLKKLGIIKDVKPGVGASSATPEAALFDAKEFEKSLKDKKAKYEEYESVVKAMGQEYADERYAALLKEGEDYALFLRNKLKEYEKNAAAIAAIAVAAEKEGLGWADLERNPTKTIAKSKGVATVSSKQPQADTKQLKDLSKILKEAEVTARKLKKEIDQLKNEKLGVLGQHVMNAGYAMQDLARFAGEFDSELGKSILKMADITGSVGNAISSFAEGDIFQKAGSIFQVGTAIASLFDGSADAERKALDAAERMAQTLELQNIALERQIRLMREASGDERIQAEADTLELISKQKKELEEQAANLDLTFSKTKGKNVTKQKKKINYDIANIDDLESVMSGGTVDSSYSSVNKGLLNVNKDKGKSKLNAQDLIDAGYSFKNLDQAQEIIDQWYSLKDQWQSLMEEFIGTTSDEIASSVFEDMQNGMSALESITQSFEDSMRNAILNSFESQYILPVAKQMFDEIAQLMDPDKKATAKADWKTANVAGTDKEFEEWYAGQIEGGIEKAKENMKASAEGVQQVWDVVSQAIEETGLAEKSEDPNSLSGGIRRELTEETGTRLAGLFNAMSIDLRANLNINIQALRFQEQIAANTLKTSTNTESSTDYLSEIYSVLVDIRGAGSAPSATKRDLGY